MNIIDAYIDEGYIYFVLDTQETKRYPTYWAFGPWSGAENHEELQVLLSQCKTRKEFECIECHTKFDGFYPIRNYVCGQCNDDLEMISYINYVMTCEKEIK